MEPLLLHDSWRFYFVSFFYRVWMGSLFKALENTRLKIIAVICVRHCFKIFLYISSLNSQTAQWSNCYYYSILQTSRHRELSSSLKIAQQNLLALGILNSLERLEYKYFPPFFSFLVIETIISSKGAFVGSIFFFFNYLGKGYKTNYRERNKTLFPTPPHWRYYLYHQGFVLRCFIFTLRGWGIQMVNRQGTVEQKLKAGFSAHLVIIASWRFGSLLSHNLEKKELWQAFFITRSKRIWRIVKIQPYFSSC